MRRVGPCALASVAVALVSVAAHAITADELAELQRQRDAVQAQRDIAVAKAEGAKAKLGTLDTATLPKGTGEATSLAIEGKILAYRSLDSLASEIVGEMLAMKERPQRVVVYSEKELDAVIQFRRFVQRADFLEQQARRITTGKAGSPSLPKLESDVPCGPERSRPSVTSDEAGGVGALTAIGIGLQVLSLFKTDQKVGGSDVTLDDLALTASVVGKLLDAQIHVIYPPVFFPHAFASSSAAPSKPQIIAHADALTTSAAALEKLNVAISQRRDLIKRGATVPKTTEACKDLLERDIAVLSDLETAAKALKGAIDQSVAALVKSDERTGVSTLDALLRAEELTTSASRAHVLQLKPIAAGGATMAKTNLFGTHFFFSGGAIVSYALYDGSSGEVMLAGTRSYYGGFVPAEELSSGESKRASARAGQ